jgi:thiol:disulfide interchange protein
MKILSSIRVAAAAGVLSLLPAAYAASGPFDPARDAQHDLQMSEQQAQAQHKLILLDIGGNWCSWCILFDRLTHEDAALHDILEAKYVVVHVNMSKENENVAFLSQFPKVPGYPHFFLLSANGKLLVNQGTDVFERTHHIGDGYDPAKLTEFFEINAKRA